MLKDIHKHIFDYLLLATVALFFLVLLKVSDGLKSAQFFIIALFIGFYIFWGILHHIHDKSLHLKVVLEYILIGAIAFFLLQTLLI